MKQSNNVRKYLNTVCEQIRWKKAHDVVSREIEDHIIDQKNAFIANGLDEAAATDKAIKEMGDPVLIGSEFDHTYRPTIEWSIVGMTGIMLIIGLAIRIFLAYGSDIQLMLPKSIIISVIGIGCMILAYFLDFTIIGKYPKVIYFSFIAIAIGTTIVSPLYNGRIYYTQFILLLFPTVFSGIVYRMRTKGYLGIILSGAFMVIPLLIGVMSSHFSSVVLLSLVCLIVLTLAIVKGWFNVKKLGAILLVYVPTVIVSIATIISNPIRLNRLIYAIVPSLESRGSGWLGTMTRKVIMNAKLIGQGDFELNGVPITSVLPSIDTDFLITYLIHRVGWISFIVIMIVILAFILRSYKLCSKQKSVLGRLVSTSVLITFTIQVIFYVINNLGFQLFSSQTLPLISYGRTATVINMILIGIMLSVFKSGDLVRDKITTSTWRKNNLFEVVDGKIIINLNAK